MFKIKCGIINMLKSHFVSFRILGLFILIMSGVLQAEVSTVLYLPLGEDQKTQVIESVSDAGNGVRLEAVGSPTLSKDVADLAVTAVGSNSCIELDGNSGFQVDGLPDPSQTNIGVELWCYALSAGNSPIFNYGGGGGIGLAQYKKGCWGVIFGKASIGYHPLPIGQWTHLAMVLDGEVARFYCNGKPCGEVKGKTPWGYKTTSPMRIGMPNDKGQKNFHGRIDAIRVFTFEPGKFDPSDLSYFQTHPKIQPAAMASIIFNQKPIENGLTFDRNAVHFNPILNKDAWVSEYATNHQMGWTRQFNLTFTDDRFRHGNMPVVDVEILARLNTWASVGVCADTARGSQVVAEQWMASPDWKLIRFQLDDAYFGARDHQSPQNKINSGGCDLRIYGYNQPLHIHKVKVTGYQLTGDVYWPRMIRSERPIGPDHTLLLFTNNSIATLTMPIRNLARQEASLHYVFTVQDEQERTLYQADKVVAIKPDAKDHFQVNFPIKDWKLGAYTYDYVLEIAQTGQRIAHYQGYLGVHDGTQLAKAKPGEFMFGLQHVGDIHDPVNQRWLEFMGVDMLRGFESIMADWSTVEKEIKAYDSMHVGFMPMLDPPKPGSPIKYEPNGLDPKDRVRKLKVLTDQLTEFATRYKGKVKYYELGNEPDLPFFYPGPVDEYVDSFKQMRAAIKQGDPDAVVMTGGLCFHTENGAKRANRIVELLSPDGVDAWAYHGHGPGYEAERNAWERQYTATAKHNAQNLTFIETETGFAANDPAQKREQARTCIEKFVYSMSKHMPVMFWFALHFNEGSSDYTTVENFREPRPAAMAYRNLVQQLRGAQFVRQVQLDQSVIQAYEFEKPSNQRALVYWSTISQPCSQRLVLHHAKSGTAYLVDMFGNRSPLQIIDDGSIKLPVTEDLTFLMWETDSLEMAGSPTLSTLPAVLEVPTQCLAGAGQNLPLKVNINTTALGHEVSKLTLQGELLLGDKSMQKVEQSISISHGQTTQTKTMTFAIPTDYSALDWPDAWCVFAQPGILKDQPITNFKDIPQSIDGVPGQWVQMENDRINLGKLTGRVEEKLPAILFARVWSPRKQVVKTGTSSDWWMQWAINGKAVYDTLQSGNNAQMLPTSHVFDLSLEKGWNLLACKVLSGSGGWMMVSAGPQRLVTLQNPSNPPDRLALNMIGVDGQVVEATHVPVMPMRLVLPQQSGWDVSSRDRVAPFAILGRAHIVNHQEAHPDRKRWYLGADDLSARLWLFHTDDKSIKLLLEVTDDHIQAGDTAEVHLTLSDGKPLLVKLSRSVEANRTVYQGQINANTLNGQTAFYIAVHAKDVDQAIDKQDLNWQEQVILTTLD